jgi:hypothetical protein
MKFTEARVEQPFIHLPGRAGYGHGTGVSW